MDVRARTIKTIALAMLLTVSGCTSWFESADKDPDVHLVKVELVQAIPGGHHEQFGALQRLRHEGGALQVVDGIGVRHAPRKRGASAGR